MSNNNSVIPLNIFQCWATKILPPGMKKVVQSIKDTNPEFTHFLFDDFECRNFIKNECPDCVLSAYDKLIPGAYKADLWRLCILYKRGGIYIDIKFSPINNFKLIELTKQEHFVKDRLPNTIYNAFMVCKPGNPFVIACINQIIRNVKINYYGKSALHPTGPGLLGDVRVAGRFKLNEDIFHLHKGGEISYKNISIMKTTYPTYAQERVSAGLRYDTLWKLRQIYRRKSNKKY